MIKLETLYASIKGLQDLGLPLNEETLKAADEIEEQLIKTEILPAMSKDIEPMLSQIQRELVLVVEYKPGTIFATLSHIPAKREGLAGPSVLYYHTWKRNMA